MKKLLLAVAIVLTMPIVAHADVVVGSAYLDNANSTNAVIGFAHGAPDATFSVPSPSNSACGGSFAGDTICFASNNSDSDTLSDFLNSGGATVLTGTPAALGHLLDNTVFEFTGMVTVTTGEMFQAGHDDGLQLSIDGVLVIDAPGGTAFTTTPATYTGPSGTFSFDLVYAECCGGPADLGISLPFISTTTPTIPEPASSAVIGVGIAAIGALRRRRLGQTSL
jgi:hypothetical protein